MIVRSTAASALDRRRSAPQAGSTAGSSDRASPDAKSGDRIRTIRRERGLTQDQLARATGVSRSAVAQWETGRASYGNKVALLAEALQVPQRSLENGRAEGARASRSIQAISTAEMALLRHFRELGSADQACVMLLTRRLATARH